MRALPKACASGGRSWRPGLALCLLLLGIPQGLRAQAEGEAETAPRLTKAPRLLRFVEAIYPPERQKAGQEASVLLELRLDASGKVDFAYVLESAGEDFDRAALEAARRFEFEAAEIDGKPAAVSLQYRYQFSLPPPRAEKDVQGALPEAAPAQETPASNIPDEEIVVRAPLEAQEAVSTRIGAEEAGRVPGTQGDAAKVVLNLPGVARPAFASGELVIWGSAPEDSRVYLDGVELPALYHLGGLRSILHSELIDEIQFVPGAYGAEYGRGLGGIVHVHNRDLMVGKKRLRASAAVDLLDASAQLEGSLGRRAALRAAGRYGWIDRIFAGVVDEIGDYVALPRYWDSQVESSWQIGAQERLNFGGLAARDSLARRLPALDPSETRSETLGRSIYRLYARYRRRFGDGAEIGLTPFFGHDAQDRASRFGPLPTEVERQSWQYGLRGFYRAPLAKRLAFEAGADLMGSSSTLSRFGTLTLPNREGDLYVFGQAPGSEVNADRWKAQIVNLAPYATLTWKAGPLTLTPGLRLDSYALAVDRLSPRVGDLPPVGRSDMQWNIEPRLAARVQILRPLPSAAAPGRLERRLRHADLGTLQRPAYHPRQRVERPPEPRPRADGFFQNLRQPRNAHAAEQSAAGAIARSRRRRPQLRPAVPASSAALERPQRLARLHLEPQRTPRCARARLPPLRLRPDPCAQPGRQLRLCALELRHAAALVLGLSAHPGGRRLL